MSADAKQAYESDLRSFRFREGEMRGDWGHPDQDSSTWANPVLWIRAGERNGTSVRFNFKFELTGYPQVAPSACLWNLEGSCPLEEAKRPRDPSGAIPIEFRMPWNGFHALYVPWDRLAITGHLDWVNVHPGRIWKEGLEISDFLDWTWELLNRETYAGIQAG